MFSTVAIFAAKSATNGTPPHHIWCISENECVNGVSLQICSGVSLECGGRGVLGIVSPAPPDDPDAPSASPSVMAEASLGDLALGLLKLWAVGLPMLHLQGPVSTNSKYDHRFKISLTCN